MVCEVVLVLVPRASYFPTPSCQDSEESVAAHMLIVVLPGCQVSCREVGPTS